MQASTVRQCLQQLTDDELEEFLATSPGLCAVVREAASKPRGARVDARMFRLWMSMPPVSDSLLRTIPRQFANEIHRRATAGKPVARTVGVRALLALDSKEMTVAGFREALEEFRADPEPAELPAAPAHGFDEPERGFYPEAVVTVLDSDGVGALFGSVRHESVEVSEKLSAAADEARAGRPVPDLIDVVSGWNLLLADAWKQLGEPTVPPDASLESLLAVQDHLAEQERQALELREARIRGFEEKLKRLETLRGTVVGLESLREDDLFRSAYEHAQQEISELEGEIELARDELDLADGSERGLGEAGAVTRQLPETPHRDRQPATEGDRVEEGGGESVATPELVSDQLRDLRVETPVVHVDTGSYASPVDLPPMVDAETSQGENGTIDEVLPSDSEAVEPREPRDEKPEPSNIYVDDLARHVRDGRFGAAWLVAKAASLPEPDALAYRLATAAFHSAPEGIDSAEVLIALTTQAGGQGFATAQSAKVALAATLRAGLAAGWIPRSELEAIARQANLDAAWRDLVEAVVAACDRNYQHGHDLGERPEPSLDNLHERARALRTELEAQRIKFTRADKILRYLLRKNGPLGTAFETILAPTTGDERRDALAEALAALESPDDVIEAADVEVNTAQQRRHRIVSHARVRLRRAIDSVVDCIGDALRAFVVAGADSQAAVVREAQRNLASAASAVNVQGNTGDPGDLALTRLVKWISSPELSTPVADDLHVLLDESLPVTSAHRDEDGLPIIYPENRDQVVAELRAPRPPQQLFDAFVSVSCGDLQAAAAIARHAPELQTRLAAERMEWVRRLRREVDAVRAELGRTHAHGLAQGAYAEAEARLIEPAEYTGDRFDLRMRELRELSRELGDYRASTGESLRRRAAEEINDGKSRDRVIALIDAEDFVGAHELLALARSGSLPSSDGDDSPFGVHVFDAFIEALSAYKPVSGAKIHEVVERFGNSPRGGEVTIEHGDLTRLAHWDNLIQRHSARSNRQATLGSILRALGLDTRGEVSRVPSPGARHFDRYRVVASPVDGSLVPGLGSRATHYMVVATADQKLLKDTLSNGFPTKNGPNIVLFDGVLTLDQRVACLNECRDQKISAIVVDHAVAAFVAARYPRSFRAVQQITLPFTCFSHYTVVAGNVPDEVFVGRAEEIATLTDRAGSLFVYGGRQLGKSALLRKIQRDFNAQPDHRAIFIDLNSHGIGMWADSQRLWSVLYNELAQIDGIDIKGNSSVRNPEPVVRAIRQWLDGKAPRRLLLLLDEADAFLENESSGSRAFENIGPLKGLFDITEGRFKPVFAGLHKVQRLQNVANTPLAHGGRDVLIGPLAAKPARDLVMKPLEALGYRFGNPEAVWRLLAFTNLQPGLIQVVCNDLVAHLQSRPLRKGEPLITIRDTDIDAVTQDPRTRAKIAEKLRLTIALEDRYRVIALVVAIMCMEDRFRERYSAADIRVYCEAQWQQGFDDLNSTEFELYMDELVGLGVLIKDDDNRFSVRSPNIVTMLGTKEQLETELNENKEQFELPHGYNLRSTRRQVEGGRRSPLSEHDLSLLVPVKIKYSPVRNFVIIGSGALGITEVARILKSVGEERAIDVTVHDPSAGGSATPLPDGFRFAGAGNSAPRLLVVDASRASTSEATAIADAVRAMKKRSQGYLVVAYGVNGIAAAQKLLGARGELETHLISLGKWSGDGIRSWNDNPFNTPADRRELLTHSGGWPELVERAVSAVSNRGISHAEEWERLSSFPTDEAAAVTFLDSVGVNRRAREILSAWVELGSTGYERIDDVADVLDCDVDEMRSLAADLTLLGVLDERHDEYAVDVVVARAVSRLG